MATLADKNPNAVALVNRYMNFRATLTGTYYGLPRVRRWALFLSVLWHLDKYDNDPARMSRKAIASMLVAEVVEHRQKYPSINLPDEVPSENTESKLALQIKDWIETHGWTLAEDRSLREAIKKFALANTRNVLQTGKVTLANGLFVNLDPDRDPPECASATRGCGRRGRNHPSRRNRRGERQGFAACNSSARALISLIVRVMSS